MLKNNVVIHLNTTHFHIHKLYITLSLVNFEVEKQKGKRKNHTLTQNLGTINIMLNLSNVTLWAKVPSLKIKNVNEAQPLANYLLRFVFRELLFNHIMHQPLMLATALISITNLYRYHSVRTVPSFNHWLMLKAIKMLIHFHV